MHFGQENVDSKEIDIAYQLTYLHGHLLCDNTYTVQKSCSVYNVTLRQYIIDCDKCSFERSRQNTLEAKHSAKKAQRKLHILIIFINYVH